MDLRDVQQSEYQFHPYNLTWIQSFRKFHFSKKVTFLVGENGTGKSTFLEAIAVNLGFNAEGGTKNFRFATKSTHSNLHARLKIAKSVKHQSDGFFFRSETYYNLATEIDNLDEAPAGSPFIRDSYGGISLHRKSRGESILALALHRFHSDGVYLLDEPESGLSITSQIALLHRISQLTSSGAQFIIATHSPFLLCLPESLIYSFDSEKLELVDYQSTTSYLLCKRFLLSPESLFDPRKD